MIDRPEIARQPARIMGDAISPHNAYRVTLDTNERLLWSADDNGKQVRYDRDPDTNRWSRLLFDFIGMFPIENQL